MLEHGGRLGCAAKQYGIPLQQWLDLSTAISPFSYPCPAIPARLWHRLPDDDNGLMEAARNYYGSKYLLPVAGSQAAIQSLPLLRSPCRAAFLSLTYNEHRAAWQKHGHQVSTLVPGDLCKQAEQLDVIVVANPNNPTGETFDSATLLKAATILANKGGWLIVDEAFIDASDLDSLARQASSSQSLIVLRSLGKFFGLAGARVGFAMANEALLEQLQEQLGPWPLSGPARYVAQCALEDVDWIDVTRKRLQKASLRLADLLRSSDLESNGGTSLFQWVESEAASELHQALARSAIFTRLFAEPQSIRFGLPHSEDEWERLDKALKQVSLSATM